MKKILNFFRSMTFGLILLGLVSLCCIAGSLIQQSGEASYYIDRYGEYGRLILSLKLDDVFRSWYFIAITALLCVNLTLCSIVRIKGVVKAAHCAIPNAAAMKNTVFLTDKGLEKLDAHMSLRYKKTEYEGVKVYSGHKIGRYGTFITHLSILLTIIFGATALYLPIINDMTCFPGNKLVMDDGTEIFVKSFSILDPDGTLNYSSNIRVSLPDGRDSGTKNISVNYPLSFGSYKIYQQTYGTAGSITAMDKKSGYEKTYILDREEVFSIDGTNGIRYEAVYPDIITDDNGNTSLVTSTVGRYKNPVYEVVVFSGNYEDPYLFFPGESIEVGDMRYTFNSPIEYPGLRIKYTPKIVNILLFSAFVLMIVGLYITFFMPPVLVRADNDGYAVTGPKPEGTRLELRSLLKDYERT